MQKPKAQGPVGRVRPASGSAPVVEHRPALERDRGELHRELLLRAAAELAARGLSDTRVRGEPFLADLPTLVRPVQLGHRVDGASAPVPSGSAYQPAGLDSHVPGHRPSVAPRIHDAEPARTDLRMGIGGGIG
ncbi:MAG: hypothetical protein OXU20_35930, partial [Myxococcales bacterium]|nr:hypothetical protein [Myxococcales bacterium]